MILNTMLKRIFYIIVIIVLCYSSPIFSQVIKLNNWKIHTSMLRSTAAAADSKGRIWVATSGGLSIYDENNNSNDTNNKVQPILVNNSNGLISSSISVIKRIPNTNKMMIGCSNGVLEIVSEDLEFTHITSIRDYGFNDARISDIYFLPQNTSSNHKAIIAGGFGLAEFDLEKRIFTSSILTIGNFPRNTAINNIVIDSDTIWVSTPLGLAKASLNQKINIPTNWTTYKFRDGSNSEITYLYSKIVKVENRFYINLGESLYYFENEQFNEFKKASNVNEIFSDIGIYNGKFFFAMRYQIYYLDDSKDTATARHIHSNWTTDIQGLVVLDSPVSSENITAVALYSSLGVAFIKKDFSFEIKTPNTPVINLFLGFALDKNGKLFAVSDNSQLNKIGDVFMGFDGKKWTNYNPLLSKFPFHYTYRSIAISPDNKVYASSWGAGIIVMDESQKDTIICQSYSNDNSALVGVTAEGAYTVVGEINFDKKGHAWAVNYGENSPGPMLVVINPDGTSKGFNSPYLNGSRWVFNMAIDANNTKWICGTNNDKVGAGLYYFNEKGTIENTNDDVWGNLTSSKYPNLINNFFNTCQYDKYTNTVWLGTIGGVAVISNPGAVLTNSNLMIVKNKLLNGQHINHIFIDAVGYKWISTKNGIWVLSIDGSELIAHFTKENTPLITDDVQSVIINPDNGLVYIGTKEGLFIAQGTIMTPQNEYDIKTYPQPFNINKDKELIIEGLTTESDIRIITPDGLLVRTLHTSSRRTVWDGKDNNGNKVPPGIYLVISSSLPANTSGAGKIAVVE